MKYTKGKWYHKITSGDQGLIIDEKTGENIAVSYKPENAPLIAASPEMYTALAKSLDWLESIVQNANNANDAKDLIIDSMPADFGLNTLRRLLTEIDGPEE